MSVIVSVLTPVPSPYQVELFNALAGSGEIVLRVVYLQHRHADRHWDAPDIRHEHVVCEDGTNAQRAAEIIRSADLAVFSWYSSRLSRNLLSQRADSRRPWVFWGERPGFSSIGWIGKIRRRFLLRPLFRQLVPIWGMGSWAVRGWQAEFGHRRTYLNVPYFSDLNRFSDASSKRCTTTGRRFLYSGSLITRKGVDLLANAFACLAQSDSCATLALLGCGSMESALRHKLSFLKSRVHFLGFCSWKDLPSHYGEGDILVAPSRYDGWGLIVPEGLAAGLPVIATDRMGAGLDFVQTGVNGWLVRAGEQGSLNRALMEAAQLPPDRLAQMSAAARRSVAGHSLTDGVKRFVSAARAALTNNGAE